MFCKDKHTVLFENVVFSNHSISSVLGATAFFHVTYLFREETCCIFDQDGASSKQTWIYSKKCSTFERVHSFPTHTFIHKMKVRVHWLRKIMCVYRCIITIGNYNISHLYVDLKSIKQHDQSRKKKGNCVFEACNV